MKIGIIGNSASGKTTLLALLTGMDYNNLVTLQAAGKIRTGIVHVPDERINIVYEKIGVSERRVYATLEARDTTALIIGRAVLNASGDNRKHLAVLREMDAIICVIKAYEDEAGNLAPAASSVLKETEDIKSELFFSDLEIIEKRIGKLEHQLLRPTPTAEKDKEELAILIRLRQSISETTDFASFRQEIEARKGLHGYGFLCLKPMIFVFNISEIDLECLNKFTELQQRYPSSLSACLKLEYELKNLADEERYSFMQDYKIQNFMTDEIIRTCYQSLNLISFLTIGDDEIRAWSIKQGDSAVVAAGKVHTDIARGFISAEVVHFNHLIAAGSIKVAREHGKVRLEGKNYIVKDGDIIDFKFNV